MRTIVVVIVIYHQIIHGGLVYRKRCRFNVSQIYVHARQEEDEDEDEDDNDDDDDYDDDDNDDGGDDDDDDGCSLLYCISSVTFVLLMQLVFLFFPAYR